jgi:hypothetical protein
MKLLGPQFVRCLAGLVLLGITWPSHAGFSVGGNTGNFGHDPVTGFIYDELRTSLQTNFPGTSFTSFSALTGDLSSFDVLVLNGYKSTPLTTAEQTAVYNYVLQGGNVIYVGEGAELPNDTFTQPFGITMVADAVATTATYTNLSHPFLTGPFGTPVDPPTGSNAAKVSVLGPSVALATWNGGGIAISAFDRNVLAPGAGFGLFFTDLSMFNVGRYPNEVDPVILNALALPEPGGMACLVSVGLSLLGRRFRRRDV